MKTTVFFRNKIGWRKYIVISVLLFFSFVLNLIVSLPTIPLTSALSGVKAGTTVNVPSTSPTMDVQETSIRLVVGPAGGCMWFGNKERICQYTLNFQPSSEFFHLPSNQNVTNHFPGGKLMISCHITTAIQAMATTFYAMGPFVPGSFLFAEIFILLTIPLSVLSGTCILIASGNITNHLKYSIPNFDCDWGFDFILSYTVVFIQITLAIWEGCVRCGLAKIKPPQLDEERGHVQLGDL